MHPLIAVATLSLHPIAGRPGPCDVRPCEAPRWYRALLPERSPFERCAAVLKPKALIVVSTALMGPYPWTPVQASGSKGCCA